ncbi:hypothetical protein Dfer_1504 [Dyadobacter fermentans DSM 18053]|uniref:Uncharacterized protein n=1 Tax=Dyadobacter fermentans (strain ATCC 700827 / DSM 18053 / CIP 107007 / KCTC 52180 / NS114) TaxID=471854 RepID=C6VRP6_DYAFD|nr:hypothetical protein Dfer_1504 [Dyadobacter fermentans DSM 18053]
MLHLKPKYVNSMQPYYLIYLSVNARNRLKTAETAIL